MSSKFAWIGIHGPNYKTFSMSLNGFTLGADGKPDPTEVGKQLLYLLEKNAI